MTFSSRYEPLSAERDVRVTQVFSSALSVSYSNQGQEAWAALAVLVLNATYEATLLAGFLNLRDRMYVYCLLL